MGRKVVVVPYHQDWPKQFEVEAGALRRVFGDQLIAVHHFGSTSVPGLWAKPIIDILITVEQIEAVDGMTAQIEALGYTAVGEYGIPGRRFFYKGTYDNRTHHLHVYQFDNANILRHLAFRDYLRTHPVPAREYSALKERLAQAFPEDMDEYIAGKNEFVKDQEQQALEWWRNGGRAHPLRQDRIGRIVPHPGSHKRVKAD